MLAPPAKVVDPNYDPEYPDLFPGAKKKEAAPKDAAPAEKSPTPVEKPAAPPPAASEQE